MPRIPKLPPRLHDFPVKPGAWRKDKGPAFRTLIFRNSPDMLEAYCRIADERSGYVFGALTMVTSRRGNDCGFLLFCRGQLTYETIAHEALHASVEYLRRKQPKALKIPGVIGPGEEPLAYSIGSCVDQIVTRIGGIRWRECW